MHTKYKHMSVASKVCQVRIDRRHGSFCGRPLPATDRDASPDGRAETDADPQEEFYM